MSFQFKERKKIVTCLFFAGVLISNHFILLEQWTAACLMIIATIRYLTSVFSASSKFKYLFCSLSVVATAFTFSELTSVLSCCASMIERILSHGHNSPEEGWYDQEEHEWVLVLEGQALSNLLTVALLLCLKGDYLNIPSGEKHKVLGTDKDSVTIWLAVFYC